MKQFDEFRIAEILVRKSTGDLSDEDRQTLDLWIAASENNRRTYEKFVAGESLRERNRRFGKLDHEKTVRGVRRKLSEYEAQRRRKIIVRWSSAAAILVAAGFLSVFMLNDTQPKTEEPIFAEHSSPTLTLDDGTEILLDQTDHISIGGDAAIVFDNDTASYQIADEETFIGYNTISVPQGNIYRLRLPDGSLVAINAGSKLRYPIPFPKNIREVWLEGEAWFQVERNVDKPFVVNYKENSLKVLGTKFNIRAYPGKGSSAALVEGSVLCRTLRDSCMLTPGYQAVIAENSTQITVEKADLRTILAWTRECFAFNGQSLKDIMNELGEWYGVKVEFADPNLERRVFTVEANRSSSINSILDILMETGKIRYEQDGRLLTIYNND